MPVSGTSARKASHQHMSHLLYLELQNFMFALVHFGLALAASFLSFYSFLLDWGYLPYSIVPCDYETDLIFLQEFIAKNFPSVIEDKNPIGFLKNAAIIESLRKVQCFCCMKDNCIILSKIMNLLLSLLGIKYGLKRGIFFTVVRCGS